MPCRCHNGANGSKAPKGRRGTRAEGHHQAVRFAGGQRPDRSVCVPGTGARPARRERRRQDDPDERALRAAPAGRGRDPAGRQEGPVQLAEGRHRGRHRDGAPALHARTGVHRGRERHPGHGGNAPVRPARPAQGPQRRARAVPALRARGRPGRPGGGPAGRHPAAGRDHQGAGQGRVRAHPRRADRGAHPGRGRRPVPHHQAAEGRRHVHRLHLAQAQGSSGDRGHDHRAAPRRGGRPEGAVRDRGRARRDDGRPERAAEGQQGRRQARRGRARRPGPDGRGRDRPDLGERDVVPGPRGRDPRPGRRAGQRADRAVRGAARAAAGLVRAHPAERPRPHPQHAPAAAARGGRLHPRGPAGRRAGQRLLGGRQYGPGQLRPAAVLLGHQPRPGRHRQQRGGAGAGVRRPHPVRRHAGGHAVRR